MNKIIIILLILPFISSDLITCNNTMITPKSKEECYNMETLIDGNDCCFADLTFELYDNKLTRAFCIEYKSGTDIEKFKKEIKDYFSYQGIKCNINAASCPHEHHEPIITSSSYLKIGFLLIFILLI